MRILKKAKTQGEIEDVYIRVFVGLVSSSLSVACLIIFIEEVRKVIFEL